jgi:hypothetical protein
MQIKGFGAARWNAEAMALPGCAVAMRRITLR